MAQGRVLSWLTPVNPRHYGWRRANLWFAPPRGPLSVTRLEADGRSVHRETLQHEILEGERAAALVDGDALEIQVNCRADVGNLEEEIPYSLAITLEVSDDIGVEIYNEIRARVHTPRLRKRWSAQTTHG